MYAKWRATWNEAAPLAMLASTHGGGGGDSVQSQTEAGEQSIAKIELKKETVRQHQLAGMPPEKIMQTQSYKDLMELDPTYRL
jgi:hypothetical protein